MARKLRLEYPGAIYHVINRGNYRGWVFEEEGDALGQVCHYIHLNPVRAKIETVDALKTDGHSSYRYLWQPQNRPSPLNLEAALIHRSIRSRLPILRLAGSPTNGTWNGRQQRARWGRRSRTLR